MEATLWHPRAPVMFIKVQLEHQGSTRNSEDPRTLNRSGCKRGGLAFRGQKGGRGPPDTPWRALGGRWSGLLNFGLAAIGTQLDISTFVRGRTGLNGRQVAVGARHRGLSPPQYARCGGELRQGTTAALLRGRCPLDRSQSSLPLRLLAPALCLRQSARIAGRAEARQRGGYGRAVGSSGKRLSSPARCYCPRGWAGAPTVYRLGTVGAIGA